MTKLVLNLFAPVTAALCLIVLLAGCGGGGDDTHHVNVLPGSIIVEGEDPIDTTAPVDKKAEKKPHPQHPLGK